MVVVGVISLASEKLSLDMSRTVTKRRKYWVKNDPWDEGI